jgi:hypothetical protein
MEMTTTQSIVRYTVKLNGEFENKAFGFSCMRNAIKTNIKGIFRYDSSSLVHMDIEGSMHDIELFLSLVSADNNSSFILKKREEPELKNFNDFIIQNQFQ